VRIEVIRHVPYIFYGNLEPWIKKWGADVWEKRFFQGSQFPEQEPPDLCIVLGGPMGVCDKDRYPWLLSEMRFLEQRLKEGTKILGICLGAQLFAEILGAKVSKANEPEVGWHDVSLVSGVQEKHQLFKELPKVWKTFHWHNDVFDIPSGAERIFESKAHANQGYLYNQQLLALQFHPEMNEEGAKNLMWRFGSSLDLTRPWVQSLDEMKAGFVHQCKNVSILESLMDRLIDT